MLFNILEMVRESTAEQQQTFRHYLFIYCISRVYKKIKSRLERRKDEYNGGYRESETVQDRHQDIQFREREYRVTRRKDRRMHREKDEVEFFAAQDYRRPRHPTMGISPDGAAPGSAT